MIIYDFVDYERMYRDFKAKIYPRLKNGPRSFNYYDEIRAFEHMGMVYRVNEESNDGLFALSLSGREVRGYRQFEVEAKRFRAEMARRNGMIAAYETAADIKRRERIARMKQQGRIDANEHAEYAGEWLAYS